MATTRSHYTVLGVRTSASVEEIRRAHRRLAHQLHPDRHATASEAEQRLAERRIREVNEAWRVLSDPGRRAAYDTSLRPPSAGPSRSRPAPGANGNGRGAGDGNRPPAPPRADPHPVVDDDEDDVELAPAAYHLLRRGPLVAILVVAALLFVVSAYAGGKSSTVEPFDGEACVRYLDGSQAQLIECSAPNDGRIVARTDAPLNCPEDTRYAQIETEFVCVPLEG